MPEFLKRISDKIPREQEQAIGGFPLIETNEPTILTGFGFKKPEISSKEGESSKRIEEKYLLTLSPNNEDEPNETVSLTNVNIIDINSVPDNLNQSIAKITNTTPPMGKFINTTQQVNITSAESYTEKPMLVKTSLSTQQPVLTMNQELKNLLLVPDQAVLWDQSEDET